MRKPTRTDLSLKDLTPRERRQLEALSRKWHRKFAARRAAIRRTQQITADDLSIIVRAGEGEGT